ncbi:MAG: LysR family transcriptional regulator, partial [Nitrospirae bacterium]|nr:LysR family transcriptional regulator [Nitrospirota bacterium]
TEKLNAGEIDIALVEGDVSKQRFSVETLLSDELVVIMSPAHPWAERRNLPAIELTKEPLIMREEGSGTRQIILKHLEEHGLKLDQLKITLVMGSTEAIKGAVEEGTGVSIMSGWAVRKWLKLGLLKAATSQVPPELQHHLTQAQLQHPHRKGVPELPEGLPDQIPAVLIATRFQFDRSTVHHPSCPDGAACRSSSSDHGWTSSPAGDSLTVIAPCRSVR